MDAIEEAVSHNPCKIGSAPVITSASGVQSVPLDHHKQILHERNRMRRFLRRVLKEIKHKKAEWVSLDRAEIEQALGLPTRTTK